MTASPTLREVLRAATIQLDRAGVDAPRNTARLLLAHALGTSKEWVIAHDDELIAPEAHARFLALVQRVVAREPLAYVLGHRPFYDLDLLVDARVLIPRPETEALVDLALVALREVSAASFACVDVGTGSGAIAIAIAKHAPTARVLATDLSREALHVARANAARYALSERIAFVQADLLAPLAALPPVIVANLPYVAHAEIEALPPEIRAHEPRLALDGGEDGLALVRRLLTQIAQRVREGRGVAWHAAFLEIGAAQGAAALEAARALLPEAHASVQRDLAGLDRVLVLRRG